MALEDDPRVYFAGERTLLAWLRSGLTVIGLGFLVARFGVVLEILRHPGHMSAPLGSLVLGVALVLLGSAMTGAAAVQHARFRRSLAPEQLPARYWTSLGLWASGLLSLLGVGLAGYLLGTTRLSG